MNDWSATLSRLQPSASPPPEDSSSGPTGGAHFYWRAAAWALDLVPFEILFVLLLWLFPAPPLHSLSSIVPIVFHVMWLALFCMVPYCLYHVYWEHEYQTTPGKWLLGLSVEYTTLPSWSQAAMRLLACCLSWTMLNVGHAMMMWRTDRKSLHDLITSTRVVRPYPQTLWGFNQPPSSFQYLLAVLAIGVQVIALLASLVMVVVSVINDASSTMLVY